MGVDDRPINTEQERKCISLETTFSQDVADPVKLHATLHSLSQGGSGLGDLPCQMSLWDLPDGSEKLLRATVDRLRGRLGERAVLRAGDMPGPEDEF